MKRIIAMICLAVIATSGMAAEVSTLGEMADKATSWLPGISDLMGAIGYVGGVLFGVMSALAFKTCNEKKESFAKPIIYMVCAGLLLALPQFMSVGVSSLFGSGQSASVEGRYWYANYIRKILDILRQPKIRDILCGLRYGDKRRYVGLWL